MEAPGLTVGFEYFDEHPPEDIARIAAARAVGKLDGPARAERQGAGRAAAGRRRRAVPRGVRARSRSGPRRTATRRCSAAGSASRSRRRCVTLVDDGALAREWGAYAIDDEGAPAQRNVLIEDGVLTDYMWDLVRARKEGRREHGNGRRETYQHLPMVRMTNTFLKPGTEDPDDIIRQTPYGLYCVALGGGQVNTATGDFVFGITEAYMIEDGQITEPVRAAQLIGNGPETLLGVDVGRQRLRHLGRHVRQGRPGRAGVVRASRRCGSRELTVGGTAA